MMKKRIVWIGLLLLCSLTLTACNGLLNTPMNAKQVERRVDRAMNDVQSYRVDIEMDYTVYVSATKVTGTAQGYMVEDQGSGADDYYAYMELTNEVKSNGTSYRLRNMEAYVDGTAYSQFGDGKVTRKLSSKMTRKEYDAYRDGDSLVELDLENCKNTEMEATENGYVLRYSGYTAQSVQDFAKASGLEKDVFGESLKDLHVTMEVSFDYLPQRVTLDPVFDVEPDAYYQPKAKITMTFSQFNEAERKTKGFSDQKYTEIESLSLLKDLEQMIEERIDAKKGSFTYKSSQSASLLTQSETKKQTSRVTYERTKDGLTFTVDSTDQAEINTLIQYSNGEKRTETNGNTRTAEMTEDEARAFLGGLINDPAMGYNTNYVSNIEKTDNGYLVTMAVSKNSALGQSIASTGATFGNGTHTIQFVMDGKKLKTLTVTYQALGMVTADFGWDSTNLSLHLNGSIQVEFDD